MLTVKAVSQAQQRNSGSLLRVSVRGYIMREVESRRAVAPGIFRRKFCILVYKALTYILVLYAFVLWPPSLPASPPI